MMLEILVVMAVIAIGVIGAAKRRRRRGKYLRGSVEEELLLSTLAGKTVLGENFDNDVTESTWISSLVATWALSNLTEAFSQGPIVVGIAHDDYTDAEIEEWLEVTGTWNVGNLVSQEISSRKIRQVGVFRTPNIALGKAILNDGNPIHTKCGWLLNSNQSLKFWAYNSGSNALATTSAELTVTGHANLWPR